MQSSVGCYMKQTHGIKTTTSFIVSCLLMINKFHKLEHTNAPSTSHFFQFPFTVSTWRLTYTLVVPFMQRFLIIFLIFFIYFSTNFTSQPHGVLYTKLFWERLISTEELLDYLGVVSCGYNFVKYLQLFPCEILTQLFLTRCKTLFGKFISFMGG